MRNLALTLGLIVWSGSLTDGQAERTWVWVNKYPTTIHSINSLILKASKLTKAGCVYRGITGATLLEAFWKPNKDGVRGGIEACSPRLKPVARRRMLIQACDGIPPWTVRLLFDHRAAPTGGPLCRRPRVDDLRDAHGDGGPRSIGRVALAVSTYRHRASHSGLPHALFKDLRSSLCAADEKEILFAPLLGQEALGTRVSGDTLIVEYARRDTPTPAPSTGPTPTSLAAEHGCFARRSARRTIVAEGVLRSAGARSIATSTA
jgi:hypothetical protein